MPILRILCYNGSLDTRTVVSLTTSKFKPLIFLLFLSSFSFLFSSFLFLPIGSRYIFLAWTAQRRLFHYCMFSRRGNMSTELFPSNGCYNSACLRSCYLLIWLHVTILRSSALALPCFLQPCLAETTIVTKNKQGMQDHSLLTRDAV
jgi:hypothetical protein